jgi:hypothetical protein
MTDKDLGRIGAEIVELAAHWPDGATGEALTKVGRFAQELHRSALPLPQDVAPSGD